MFLHFVRLSLLTISRAPRIAVASAHLRFFNATHSLSIKQKKIAKETALETHNSNVQSDELTSLEDFNYPRIVASQTVGHEDFRKTYGYLKSGETVNDLSVTICGNFSAPYGDYSFSLCIKGGYIPSERQALRSVSLM